ncbi:Fulicin peptides like protein [Argiope bruennichi]|uniref:Fulicin peptides like protein n=1 Tax=Argiope bruennichi TaxID=94029 RepID=A0A8T0E4M3_ARGBR|nr:Fulicin peptides like protein [Argiope bruennichi]
MAFSRQTLWVGACLPMLLLFILATLHPSVCTSNDYSMDVLREPSTALSDNTLRHIMQLISLGTGLNVPPPLNLRFREKSLKRARISAPHPRRQDYVIGSEFLGKRSPQEDKRMGSEFLGKRMGSEFLGKRMGSEFLGKRMGSEFLGKRIGSEFLGKRSGEDKRMGSEFLGKRSEYYDEDDESMDEAPFKRMGSEFLGKRSKDEDELILGEGVDRSLESEKRMGSEFLGRKRRETKTTDRRSSSGA